MNVPEHAVILSEDDMQTELAAAEVWGVPVLVHQTDDGYAVSTTMPVSGQVRWLTDDGSVR